MTHVLLTGAIFYFYNIGLEKGEEIGIKKVKDLLAGECQKDPDKNHVWGKWQYYQNKEDIPFGDPRWTPFNKKIIKKMKSRQCVICHHIEDINA